MSRHEKGPLPEQRGALSTVGGQNRLPRAMSQLTHAKPAWGSAVAPAPTSTPTLPLQAREWLPCEAASAQQIAETMTMSTATVSMIVISAPMNTVSDHRCLRARRSRGRHPSRAHRRRRVFEAFEIHACQVCGPGPSGAWTCGGMTVRRRGVLSLISRD